MPETHIIALLYPKADKLDRFKELGKWMAEQVHSKEDYTIRYMITEQLGAEEPTYIMIETYKSKEGADKHLTEPHFQELFKKFTDEEVFAKAPWLAQSVTIAGFDNDHTLV